MKSFSITRLGTTTELAKVTAERIDYTGGDGTVIAVFRRSSQPSSEIVALATLEPGLIIRANE